RSTEAACAIKNSTSENIDISEILSINHIFLLEQNDNAGIQMFFDSDKWKKMFVQIVSELPAYEISIDEQNDNAGIQMFFDSDKWKKMFVQIVSELPAYEISIDGLECCHVVGRVRFFGRRHSGAVHDSNDDSPDETQSTSDHEYLPSSSEASDDTFTKIKKNVYTFDCLWVIDDYDISKLLMEYRACAIKNSTSENIDISEILSINHIFLLEQNDNAGIQMFFDSDKWKKMFVQIVSELPAYEISIDGLECCHVVGRVASSNVNECESLIRKLRKKYGNSEDIILDVLYSVTKILENKTRSRKEDTFVHDNIEPMLNNFFQNGKLYRCEWSTTVLEESAHLMEVKPVKPNTNPLFSDLRKLGNEMKDIIDKCIEDGIYDDRA
ncbi:4199_t:CDS:10, partial [Entrophospora sp. SA101]